MTLLSRFRRQLTPVWAIAIEVQLLGLVLWPCTLNGKIDKTLARICVLGLALWWMTLFTGFWMAVPRHGRGVRPTVVLWYRKLAANLGLLRVLAWLPAVRVPDQIVLLLCCGMQALLALVWMM